MIKKYKTTLIVSSLLILLPMVAGLLLWNRLPDTIATHFGVGNVANGWSGKPFTVLVCRESCWYFTGSACWEPMQIPSATGSTRR